ncbi:MAG: MMPL family transporter [Actinobacteria bacterium]|nr:MMPL family transporter [Actinomycetota bacterium]
MLTRLGRFTVRRRRLVLSFTVLFMVLAAVVGAGAFGVLKDGGFDDPASESARAAALLEEHFGGGDPNVVLVASVDAAGSAPAGAIGVDDPSVVAAGADLAARLDAIDGVEQVVSYWSLGSPPSLRSTDGDTALVLARVTGDDEQVTERIDLVKEAVTGTQGPFDVLLGGREAVFADVGETIEGDLLRAELIAVPLTLILLLFVFRGLVAAALPMLVGVIAVLGTLLSLFVIGSITDVSLYAINLTTALGLGLAIDYSLFIVSRFREELQAGRNVEGAVIRTMETAGKTVLISALTVAVSLAALLVFPLYFLRSFAYAGVAVVLLALAGSLLSLPALLAVLGHRVNSLRIGRRRVARADREGAWHRIAMFVMRRPVPIAAAAVAVLLFLGAPFLRVAFGTPDDRVLPMSAESRQASEILRSDFTGNSAESFGVVVDGVGPERLADLGAAAATISSMDGVARVDSAAGTFVDGALAATTDADARFLAADGDTVSWMSVVPSFAVVSEQGEQLVKDIRSLDLPVEVAVEGSAAELVDTKAAIGDALPLALAIIVVATLVLLFMLSGSVLVPIKALVLNFLSLTATFGAMVWIFQDGNLAGVFDFTATGTIDTSMPILMFCIAFGLSMDYEVFLLARIKEEHDRTGDNEASVALGLERTGSIVTAAAALLAITFFAFGTSGVSFIKMFGIGLGLAVLMDATIVRAFLVPAFMRLAGEANWWAPAPLRRFHDRYGLREGDGPETAAGAGHQEDERTLVGADR